MQPLKISILGDFWDCQIYRGRLYLWTMDGRLMTYKWDEWINSIRIEKNLKVAFECAFSRGDYLYDQNLRFLFSDEEIVEIIRSKFEKLSEKQLHFQLEDIAAYLHGEQDVPCGMLSIDSDFYNNNIFFATDSGLWRASAHRPSKKYPVSSKPAQLWDGRVLSLKARGGRIALSAGDDGLYEYDTRGEEFLFSRSARDEFKKIDRNLVLLNKHHSCFSNWNYQSIYSTSNVDESHMILFAWDKEKEARKLINSVNENRLFKERARIPQLSWGGNNKIYRTATDGIDVINYTQGLVSQENATEAFTEVEHIPFQPWKGTVIAGGIAYFGVVIECENALVIMKDADDFFNIPGNITRWRTYPRSIRYENHLHVVSDEKIDIYSFNHDYFREQKTKKIGVRYDDFTNRNIRRQNLKSPFGFGPA